jgi:CCDC81-like prokaryotic HU domain 2/SPOR domain/CCDC81-like prokaryotic HU domain 1
LSLVKVSNQTPNIKFMQNIFQLLRDFLFENGAVIFPGFGNLYTEYLEAHWQDGLLLPPRRVIHFRDQPRNADTALAQFIAQQQNITADEAQQQVQALIEEIKQQVRYQKTFEIEGIGTFSLDSQHKMLLEANVSTNFLGESFGLPQVAVLNNPTDIVTPPPKPESVEVVEELPIPKPEVVEEEIPTLEQEETQISDNQKDMPIYEASVRYSDSPKQSLALVENYENDELENPSEPSQPAAIVHEEYSVEQAEATPTPVEEVSDSTAASFYEEELYEEKTGGSGLKVFIALTVLTVISAGIYWFREKIPFIQSYFPKVETASLQDTTASWESRFVPANADSLRAADSIVAKLGQDSLQYKTKGDDHMWEEDKPANPQVQATPPNVPEPKEKVESHTNDIAKNRYYVIAGSFGSEKNAKTLKKTLEAQGYQVELFYPKNDEKLIKVSAGNYNTLEEATAKANELMPTLPGVWVLRPTR